METTIMSDDNQFEDTPNTVDKDAMCFMNFRNMPELRDVSLAVPQDVVDGIKKLYTGNDDDEAITFMHQQILLKMVQCFKAGDVEAYDPRTYVKKKKNFTVSTGSL